MNKLVSLVEKIMRLKIPKFKIPYFIGFFCGLCFDFIALLTKKNFSISSVRVKKFCATTQFDSRKVENIFEPPYSLESGLNKTLDYEFITPKEDNVLFYTE